MEFAATHQLSIANAPEAAIPVKVIRRTDIRGRYILEVYTETYWNKGAGEMYSLFVNARDTVDGGTYRPLGGFPKKIDAKKAKAIVLSKIS